jgi:hypothetical protein
MSYLVTGIQENGGYIKTGILEILISFIPYLTANG